MGSQSKYYKNAYGCLYCDSFGKSTQHNHILQTVDFNALAEAQSYDAVMQKLQCSATTFKLTRIPVSMYSDTILCDASTGRHAPIF